jgi:ligand-binding sensor domain-containing protein
MSTSTVPETIDRALAVAARAGRGGGRAMRRPVGVLFTLLWLVWAGAAVANPATRPLTGYSHDVWQDGLPQSSLLAVTQTRDGYLWVGTYEGLVRFSGVDFVVFDRKKIPVLKSNACQALFEDSRGALWIGTSDSGLVRMEGGRFTVFGTESGLPSERVFSICEDAQGNIVVGTRQGLALLENGAIRAYGSEDLRNASISTVLRDHAGALWVGTVGQGLQKLQDGRWTRIDPDRFPDSNVTALVEDRSGRLWIGSLEQGLYCYDGSRFLHYGTGNGLPRTAREASGSGRTTESRGWPGARLPCSTPTWG